MKAVVMAGGEGSRLRPLTIRRPKPMVQVVNRPCIEHILLLLRKHGITDVVVTLQYLAEQIQDHFGDGSQLGMNLIYSVEESPLGTAGSVGLAREHLDETFVVISGDAITDFDLGSILAFHRERKAEATLTLYRVPNPLEYGVVISDDNGKIRQFLEKPSWGEVFSDTINTGIYVLEPSVFDDIPAGKPVDFSGEVFPKLLAEQRALYGYIATGYWCDIGSISEYQRACADVLNHKVDVGDLGTDIGGGVYIESSDVEISPDAMIYGPVWLGSGVRVKSGAVIYGPSVVRPDTTVDRGAQVDRSIVWRGSSIGERAEVRGAIIGTQCNLKSKSMVFEGAVIGDGTAIGEGSIVQPNVKIWPDKQIDAGATVAASIIWGNQARRGLFSRYGISGSVNVELTPEFSAKLGAAYGATLPRGAKVIMSRDPHRTPRMIKRALIAGVPSAGCDVLDVKSLPIPVTRYVTRETDAVGGVHIRLSPFDHRVVDIKFFTKDGLDIEKNAERKIEQTFFREDFRRANSDEIGGITETPQLVQIYEEGFRRSLSPLMGSPVAKRMTVVVDYAHGTASQILPNLLSDLGLEVISLNASVDELKLAVDPGELEQSMQLLGRITVAVQADFGVRLEVGGEKLFAVDNSGRQLESARLAAAVACLVLQQEPGAAIAVPVSAPRVFEDLAERFGGRIVRTRVSQQALTAASADRGVAFIADLEGGMAFPAFHPAMDGLYALVKIEELLSRANQRLSAVADALPSFALARRSVHCDWDKKGRVMRQLNEQYRQRQSEQVDGIRIDLGREWVLILPDADRPLFHIIAEARTPDGASDLVEKYTGLVDGMQRAD